MKIQTLAVALVLLATFAVLSPADAADQTAVRTGNAAFGDWTTDAPGVRRKITVADLPPPYATGSAGNFPRIVAQPADATLKVPPGFKVEQFAAGLAEPRLIRIAPNGDIFIAESSSNRIRVMRAADGASKPERSEIFADGLSQPFGIAFWPPGPSDFHPRWFEDVRLGRIPYQRR
jgi:glucose/arabinose dehydrogenase